MQPRWKRACLAGIVWGGVAVMGCASAPQPFDYHEDRDEKPGPGLFSGEEGGFVIFGGTKEEENNQADPPVDAE